MKRDVGGLVSCRKFKERSERAILDSGKYIRVQKCCSFNCRKMSVECNDLNFGKEML